MHREGGRRVCDITFMPMVFNLTKSHFSYVYEVCLFDEARQRPLKGGQTFSLGYVALDWG